ncbi:GNAT family N-acetyltransferase [Nakamurella silvestris]|nr:GNAT family N-acetyltransferase [Nakamurella silvestris]
MGEASVRRAAAADSVAIAEIQLQVWAAGFAEVLPAELLQADPAELAQNWSAMISLGHEQVLLAAENEHIVGFVHAGGRDGAIHILYVRPAWARRGHGGRLFAAAGAQLAAAGAEEGHWWVPETDVATTNFVRSVGWHSHGEARVLDTGAAHLREVHWAGELTQLLGPVHG